MTEFIILSRVDMLTLCNELFFVLESRYEDYPAVDLMVENLTNRFKERLGRKSE